MRNVTLKREANPAYQLATGSRFFCRPPPLAENYKGVDKTEVSAVTNSASISIVLIAVHWYRSTTGGFVLLFCSLLIFICFYPQWSCVKYVSQIRTCGVAYLRVCNCVYLFH